MKKLLALLPFLALVFIFTSCSDDDKDDNPVTPTPKVKVLELISDASINESKLMVKDGDNSEIAVYPTIKNTGDATVEIKMEIEITSIEGENVSIGACLGDGTLAQCLSQFSTVGKHTYSAGDHAKYITLAGKAETHENHLSVHYYINNNVGKITGNLILTNKNNAEDVITIPYTFESKKMGF
jgi:hypothetical protein